MSATQKKRGHYLGTEIDHKWWRRYSKEGFYTRGSGEYWINDGFLFFQHHSKQTPIRLPLRNIVEIVYCPSKRKTRSDGTPLIKLIWQKEGKWLSSVFALYGSPEETSGLLASLRAGI